MSVLLWLLGAVSFVVVLLVSVALHELGHLTVAKKLGLHVPTFSVGFGRPLLKRSWRGTEWRLSAVPLGGYVRIENPGEEDQASDEAMLLSNVSPWRRQLVFLAGPAVNIVIGVLLFVLIFTAVGLPFPNNRIQAVSCDATTCVASEAGLEPGDEITSINGETIRADNSANAPELLNTTDPVTIDYVRDGEEHSVEVTPENGTIGVEWGSYNRTLTPSESMLALASVGIAQAQSIANIPASVPDLFRYIGGEERPADSPASVVGAARYSGDYTADEENTVRQKGTQALWTAAAFNVGIGVINLLPFLPLDGGRMLVAFMDSVKMRWAHMRKKSYRPTGVRLVSAMTWVFGGLLLSYMTLLIAVDIVNPLRP